MVRGGAWRAEMIAQALLSEEHRFRSQLCSLRPGPGWVTLGQLLNPSEPHLHNAGRKVLLQDCHQYQVNRTGMYVHPWHNDGGYQAPQCSVSGQHTFPAKAWRAGDLRLCRPRRLCCNCSTICKRRCEDGCEDGFR